MIKISRDPPAPNSGGARAEISSPVPPELGARGSVGGLARPPWPAAVAALIGFAALALSAGRLFRWLASRWECWRRMPFGPGMRMSR